MLALDTMVLDTGHTAFSLLPPLLLLKRLLKRLLL